MHGDGGKAALQRGEAAGLVAGVAVQLGAAVFVLLRLGVQHPAAQTVEFAPVIQDGQHHGDHRQQRHQCQPEKTLFTFLRHTAGRLLLRVAAVECHLIH